MNPKVESVMKNLRRVLLLALLTLDTGTVSILLIHESPLEAYAALFKSALVGKLKTGTTLANFTPLLLTSTASAVAAKVGAFNVGVEGEVFLGGMAAAYVGVYYAWLPRPLLLAACFVAVVIVGAAQAWTPGLLKVYYGVSEVCTTILMNSVVLYITPHLVSGPISAGITNPQSVPVGVTLPRLLKPSNVSTGLFIAITAVTAVIWMLNRTALGYKIRTVGTNPTSAEYIGINPKKVFIRTMMPSGATDGLTGHIGVPGIYGYFLNNFAVNLGTSGMLASPIIENNVATTPFIAFFLAMLRSGALSMQQDTGVPRSIVDTTTVILIIVATMELLFQFSKEREVEADAQWRKDICNSAKSLIFH